MNTYPLSQAQKRIWYSQKKHKNSSLYNIGGTVEIQGIVEISILKQAIQSVYKHNRALRLQFYEEENEVFQYISEEDFIVDEVDFSQEEKPVRKFDKWCKNQAKTPFNMEKTPLCYFATLKISNNETGYFIKIHHIIADGWSIKLFTDQVNIAYENIISNNTMDNVDKPSYLDYIKEEVKYIDSDYCNIAKKYWLEKFTVHPNIDASSEALNSNRKSIYLDNIFQSKIESYIKNNNISLNTFFLFIFILYEYKKNFSNDIIIGTPLLGRSGKTERQTIGTFTNTMPYRYRIEVEEPINKMMKRISDDIRNSLRHQKYPYNLLHNELKLNESGVGLLYNTCINYYNTEICSKIGGMPVKNTEFYNGQQEYNLQIVIRHWNDNELQLDFDYQTAMYSEKQIDDMYYQIKLLILQALADDTKCVKDLLLINEEDKKYFLYGFNETEKEFPRSKTFIDLLSDIIREYPDKIAISKDNEYITYGELENLSNMAAGCLISKGIKKGDITAVIPEHTIQSVIAIIAVMKCGAVYLPIDKCTPMERIRQVLLYSDASFLIAEKEEYPFKGSIILLHDLMMIMMNYHNEGINLSVPNMTAYIIYTSGSTGMPKGVKVTNKNLINYLWWAKRTYVKNNNEVFALYSSFSFDFTLTSIFLPLISGGEVRIYEKEKEANILKKVLEENKTTILKITPSHIPLVNDVQINNTFIHTFIIGGENLQAEITRDLYRQFGKKVDIYNEYGPTETTIGCMIYLYNGDEEGTVPIGRPISNTQIYLLDVDKQPVPYDTQGELYIGGEGVSRGYYKLDSETNLKFLNNPFIKNAVIYKTGDMALRNRNGDIVFIGREDNEVKIRGNRVNLFEIENKILSSGMVKEVFVKTVNNQNSGSMQLGAYMIGNTDYNKERLEAFLKERLPVYMLPEFYIKMDSFPTTINGKIDSKKLPEMAADKIIKKEWIESEELKVLLKTVKDIINNKNIGAHDNFYGIGGDSIKAIQISSRLYEKGYELSVRDMLSYPVLYEMLEFMSKRVVNSYEQGIVFGEIKITSIQKWFLNQKLIDSGQYNQSVLLEIKKSTPDDILEQIVLELIKHHDGLRINYDNETDKIFYNSAHLDKESVLNIISLDQDSTDLSILLKERINHSFNLKVDLLIRPYLIKIQSKQYLFITVHHLAVDGVSFRILLEDIQELLSQYIRGQAYKLSEKTAAYSQFAVRYEEWIKDYPIEEKYWEDIEATAVNLHLSYNESIIYKDIITEQFVLEKVETDILIGKANESYNTKTKELLLIALAFAVKEICYQREVVIEVESHGRDILQEVNINRTVGWFTSMYPIKLKIPLENLNEQIKSLKEQIRNGQKKGYEYNVLINRREDKQPNIRYIRFNYLGEITNSSNEYFSIHQIMSVEDVGQINKVSFLAEVNAFVMNERLYIFVRGGNNWTKDNENMTLASCYKKQIKNLIIHCETIKNKYLTPSDFDLVNITQKELDKILK